MDEGARTRTELPVSRILVLGPSARPCSATSASSTRAKFRWPSKWKPQVSAEADGRVPVWVSPVQYGTYTVAVGPVGTKDRWDTRRRKRVVAAGVWVWVWV